MSYRPKIVLLSLMLASIAGAAEDRIDALIRDLANPDPEKRQAASEALIEMGEAAREKLTQASRSPKPAIATAASAALAKLPWDRPTDPAVIAEELRAYGDADPEVRAGILLNMLAEARPEAPAIVVRVLTQEPSPRVGWVVAVRAEPDKTDAWAKAVAPIDPNAATPPLRAIRARQLIASDTPDAVRSLDDALRSARDEQVALETNLLLGVYSLAARHELHDHAAWALEQVIQSAGGEAFVLNRGDAQTDWPNAEMVTRVKWHRFKDAESRKDEKAMQTIAAAVLEANSSDMSIFLDVLPTLEKHAEAAKIDAYFERAYEQQRARLAEEPDEPVHKNDLAWLLARSGRKLDEAEPLAEAAVKAKPDEAAYLDTLAEVKFRLGKIDEAIALEKKALQYLPGDKFMTEQLQRFEAARAATQPAQ